MFIDAFVRFGQFDHYYFNNERLAIKLLSKSRQHIWSMVSKYNQEQNGQSITYLESNIRTFNLKTSYKNLKQNIYTKKKSNICLTQITYCSNYGYNIKSAKIKNSTRTSSNEFDLGTTICQKQQDGIRYLKEIIILSIQ
ncbi:unnamed protein product [Paramecium sonneborni]|uniref:Uncharacterized protein n=1 Tax=Paramecium sonneborni TaxID=65129 RepID=A0A8S1L8Z7_9CILI|nr:unnamed protein product [Paramecium sonneborni]